MQKHLLNPPPGAWVPTAQTSMNRLSASFRMHQPDAESRKQSRIFKGLLLVAVFVLGARFQASAQLTGVKTIPGDYATIAAAITDLNTAGVGTGGVTFNIAAGYTETASNLVITAAGTATDPIIFQKSGTGANPKITAGVGTSATLDGIIKLSGADYITFDGLTLEDAATNTTTTTQMEWGFAVLRASNTNGCQFVTIKNCAITLTRTNTNGVGIHSSNHTITSTTAVSATGATAAGTNSNNKFFGNTINNAYTGIKVEGIATATVYDMTNEVGVGGANIITNFGGAATTTYGIYTISQDNIKIGNNNISGTGSTGTLYGIFNNTATNSNVEIFNNTVNITSAATTSTIYGINNAGGGTGTTNLVKMFGNNVQMSYPTATSGIVYVFYNSATAQNIEMYNNTISNISKAGTGVGYIFYQSAAVITNANIYNNIISNITGTGTGAIYLLYSSPATTTNTNIYDNTISGVNSAGSTLYGIYCTAGLTNNVYRNRLFDLTSSTTGAALYGIYSTSGSTNNFYNNFISDLKTPAATGTDAIRAIAVGNSTAAHNIGVYFNTIFLNATSSSATTFGTSGIWASATPTVELRNNIIVNISTPGPTGGLTAAYRRSSTTLTTYSNSSNTNLFYAGTPSANQVIFTDGTNSDQTLTAFKTRVAPRDAASVSALPPFVNIATAPYDLHIKTNVPTQVESAGTPVTTPIAITTDFDGQPRDASTPDLGADEGNFMPQDLTPPSIIYTTLANTLNTTGDRTITATISDANGVYTTGSLVPRIYFRLNSGTWMSTPGVLTSGTGTSGTWTFTISGTLLGTRVAGDVVSYYVVAQDMAGPDNVGSSPSGVVATDVNTITTHPASPNSYLIQITFSGTINVGSTETITSLTGTGGLFDQLNNNAMGGNLTVNITSDLTETGAIALNQILEVGTGGYTVTIQPSAAVNRIISGTVTGGLIRLNGADRIVFNGNFGGSGRFLTIMNNTTATNSAAIQIISLGTGAGAINNAIRNVNISGGSNSVTSAFGIYVGSATISTTGTGAENNGLTIDNNVITKAYYAIYARGVASTGLLTGLTITNNTIGSNTAAEYVTYRGVDIQNATAAVISSNTIFNLQLTTSATNIAIEIGQNSSDAMVTRNRIYGLRTTSTSGYGSYGINIASGTGNTNITIANNMISDIVAANYSVTSTAANPFGIRITGGTNHKIYYNSIYLFGAPTTGTAASMSAPIIITSNTATGLDIRNNILANSMTGISGTKTYAIYAVTGTTFGTINYNDYFAPITGYLGTEKATLAEWKTATTQDVNSLAIDPEFISQTNLHIATDNFTLNNSGTPITGFTTDFDGDTRSATTPDMGADEFSPASTDLSSRGLVVPVQKTCYGNAEQVTITIRNSGLTAINFTTMPATVTVNVSGAVTQALSTTISTNSLNGGVPLASGAFLEVPVGTLNMTTVGAYTFNASVAIVSGGTDGNLSNNAIAPVIRTVNVLAAGTAAATQDLLCLSGTTTLNLTGNTGGDVKWQQATTASGPFTDIAGATSASFTLPTAINQTMYYQAVVFCGTSSAISNTVTVTVNNPQLTSTGASRCGNGPVTLNAVPSAGTVINWYTSATGGSPVATGNTYTPTVTATTDFFAESTLAGNTGTLGALSNAIGTGAQSTATHYLFFDVFTNATLNSVYVYPNAAGNVVIELRNSANTILQTATVAVTAAQIGVKTLIPLNFSLIPGTGYKLGRGTAGVSLYRNDAGATYPYTMPGVLSITGNSFDPLYYYWGYEWSVTPFCSSARQMVTATVNPIPTVSLGPDITRCGTALLNAGNPGATYQWLLNSVAISGATSQTYNATASGSYIARVTNASGCANTDTIVVVIDALPVKPTITAASSTTICQGNSVNLTGASTTSGVTYSWLLNNTAISGATNAIYSANTAGNYRVIAMNAAGCTDTSTVTSISVNPLPATPTITVAAGGSTTICTGGSVGLTGASTTTGATYQWRLNGTPITGATSASYSATAAGSYTVIATVNGCPSAPSAATVVTVNTPPATPTISQNGGTLTSSATTGNQWYLNGTLIPGATGQTLITTSNGAYTVVVTGSTGCASPASAVKTVTNTGLGDALANMSVQVYPNPASGSFNVKLSGYQKDAIVVLYNLAGQQIISDKASADGNARNISLKGLAAGTYLLKVSSDKGVQVTRLVVQ